MPDDRKYTSRRQGITKALADVLSKIDGRGLYYQAVAETSPRLKFWDEVEEFPAIHLNAGSETRQYQTGGYKDRFVNITVRCYINQEDSVEALDELLEDVETVLDDAGQFDYGTSEGTKQISQLTVISISTDEGALQPLGVGEMIVEIRY